MAKWLTWVFAVLAVGCLAAAGYLAFRPPAPEPPLEVRSTEQDLGTVPLGKREVAFSVYNPSSQPRRVIGTSSYCNGDGCISSEQPTPIIIAPGETVRVALQVTVARPGAFSLVVPVFLDEGNLRTETVIVRGTGEASHAPPKS